MGWSRQGRPLRGPTIQPHPFGETSGDLSGYLCESPAREVGGNCDKPRNKNLKRNCVLLLWWISVYLISGFERTSAEVADFGPLSTANRSYSYDMSIPSSSVGRPPLSSLQGGSSPFRPIMLCPNICSHTFPENFQVKKLKRKMPKSATWNLNLQLSNLELGFKVWVLSKCPGYHFPTKLHSYEDDFAKEDEGTLVLERNVSEALGFHWFNARIYTIKWT